MRNHHTSYRLGKETVDDLRLAYKTGTQRDEERYHHLKNQYRKRQNRIVSHIVRKNMNMDRFECI